MKYLSEIFKLQRELNILIKRDTVGAEKQQRYDWVFGYLFAAAAETNELLECVDLDTFNLIERENSLIEVIDIWHFITSVCHLIDIYPTDIILHEKYIISEPIINAVIKFNIKLNKIITSEIAFKWWSVDVKNDPTRQFRAIYNVERLKANVILLFQDLIKLSYMFGMSDDDILSIYKMKHQKNIARQIDNYDVRTKTETDNQEIIQQIESRQFKVIMNREPIITAAKEIFTHLVNIFGCLGQTPDDVLNVYKLKWEKNIARQENGYDVRNKTEEDNQEIIQQMTQS